LTGKRLERRLAAILAADVVGYSRLVSADEADALARLGTLRRDIIEPNIAGHSGRLFKIMGDGFFAEFASAVQAISCALAIQVETEAAASALSDAQKMQLRIGVHVGDVMVEGEDLMGDGVNIAARLEGIAETGGIFISRAVHDQVRDRIKIAFDDKGEVALKNITRPVHVFAVGALSSAAPAKAAAFALALPDKPSIAVLPFQNMSGDPEQEYFADGVVEEIITALARFKAFFVIARNSSFTYKGKAIDIRQVGQELGVRYVLEGSIRKAGNRVRITGQLIEAQSGRHVWAEKFEGDLADIFDLQDRITQSVVGAIEPTLLLAETDRAKTKPTASLNAYDHYLLALASSYTWTRNGFETAQTHLLKAIALDPGYSLAKGVGSLIVMRRKMQSWTTEADIHLGIRWAREALASDRDDPITLRSAGQAIAILDRDFELGLFSVRRAVSICPNSALVLHASGWVHAYVGDVNTAAEHFHLAMRLSPRDPEKTGFLAGLAMAYIVVENYETALDYASQAILEQPCSAVPLRMAAVALGNMERRDEARAMGQRLLALTPEFRLSKASIPPRDPGACERFINGLRLAGIPE
jgi:adenylate cyclase